MRLGVPLVSLTREDFAEAPLLLTGIQNYAYHQILTPDQFFSNNWEFLCQKPQPPCQSDSLPTNGTEAIAQAIVDYFMVKE